MKFIKVTIVVEMLMIGLLLGLLLLAVNKPEVRDQPSLITHFDQPDLDRVKEMIHRFDEGLGDNLTFVKWGIDSGPFIYDFYNDGRELFLRVDMTRDGMSANPAKTEYSCKAIELVESAEFYKVELSGCRGYPKAQRISMISFDKENL